MPLSIPRYSMSAVKAAPDNFVVAMEKDENGLFVRYEDHRLELRAEIEILLRDLLGGKLQATKESLDALSIDPALINRLSSLASSAEHADEHPESGVDQPSDLACLIQERRLPVELVYAQATRLRALKSASLRTSPENVEDVMEALASLPNSGYSSPTDAKRLDWLLTFSPDFDGDRLITMRVWLPEDEAIRLGVGTRSGQYFTSGLSKMKCINEAMAGRLLPVS